MPLPGTPAEATNPPTCEVRDWRVFTNGFHKDSYYNPAMVERIAANFAAIPPNELTPVAGLGHDVKKRLAASLGLPNVGEVTGCRATPNGDLFLTITNIPTWLGGMISARRYRAGSVELLPKFQNPKDPAEEYPGPVLSGIAFLGEEQPAVKGCDLPRAVFADGRPVPANHDPLPVHSEVMASLYSESAANPALCFSDATPTGQPTMTPEKEAALVAAGFMPEEIEKIKSALVADIAADAAGGAGAAPLPADNPNGNFTEPLAQGGTPTEPGKTGMMSDDDAAMMSAMKFADDPAATPEQKMMGAMCKKMSAMSAKFAEDTKRTGAMEAKMAADAAKGEEAKMAAFSDSFNKRLEKVLLEGRVTKIDADTIIRPKAKDIQTTKTFAAESDRFAALDRLMAPYEASPISKQLVEANRSIANGNATTPKDAKGNAKYVPATSVLGKMIREGGPLDRIIGMKNVRDKVALSGS